MEFSQLKNEYKFLGDILKLYDKMDQTVVENEQNKRFLNLCDKNDTFNIDLTAEQKNTCKKLIRNFFLINGVNREKVMYFCSNLYVWLYYEIKISSISNEIIKEIFELPKSRSDKWPEYYYCPYVTFNDKINKPENLMKLSIFNDNAGTFQTMLKDSKESNYCYLKKFVYECVDIYREINRTYNVTGDCKNSPQKNACELSKEFHGYYTSEILSKDEIRVQFPELSPDTPLNYKDDYPIEDSKSDKGSDETQHDTPTTGGVSTALSAMVGIPPFLALIYKFTPAGKLFRFGNKKHTIITSDFDKNMENELFHAIKEDTKIKNIQPKYNIGYEPK